MNYYSIPGTGVFGGIKTAAQFVDFLNDLTAPACLVTPEGDAPQWFSCHSPVMSEPEMMDRLTPEDHLIFSLPFDYPRFRELPCRLIYHCQGHHPAMAPIARDPQVTLLSAWQTARAELEQLSGREVYDTGICVSERFFPIGRLRDAHQVACMPRRGAEILDACAEVLQGMQCRRIEGMHENEVAEVLQTSSIYLATSVDECFGLPALEAMAAGCVVLTVPVIGGREYLRPGETCFMASPGDFPATVRRVLHETDPQDLQRIRECGTAMASTYLPSRQRSKLKAFLQTSAGKGLCPLSPVH